MALIKCPECSLSISDKAAACPNCGYPLQPAPEPVEYELTRSNPSESKLGKFLRACVWVDGICLIIWTIVIIAIYTGETFDWGGYFTTLVTYALYGCLIWCFASLSDDVHNISSALTSLQLLKKPLKLSEYKPVIAKSPEYKPVIAKSSEYKPIAVGHSVLFGSYPQGDADGSASPIEWLIITTKEDKSLLLSKNILDFKPYDANLRHWLNEDFYTKSFSESGKQKILPTQFNDANESFRTDRVFLLNATEVTAYLDSNAASAGNNWWLRNSSESAHRMAYVDCNGNICECMNPTMNGGVRPCIWVQNKSLQFPTV